MKTLGSGEYLNIRDEMSKEQTKLHMQLHIYT